MVGVLCDYESGETVISPAVVLGIFQVLFYEELAYGGKNLVDTHEMLLVGHLEGSYFTIS